MYDVTPLNIYESQIAKCHVALPQTISGSGVFSLSVLSYLVSAEIKLCLS